MNSWLSSHLLIQNETEITVLSKNIKN